jgi:hypothetical protein
MLFDGSGGALFILDVQVYVLHATIFERDRPRIGCGDGEVIHRR